MDHSTAILIYNIFNSISIFMSFIVLIFLFRVSKWNSYFSVLLANFHLSLILEGITAIPYVYRSSHSLCIGIEVVRMYMDLWNICIVFALIVCHCAAISGKYSSVVKTRKYLRNWIYIYPLVMCLLPLATNDYSYDDDNPWCSIQHRAYSWPVLLCYTLVWLGLLNSLVMFSITFYRLWKTTNVEKLLQVFGSTVGLYALGGFSLWVPRSIVLFSRNQNKLSFGNYFYSNLPIAIEGIIFFTIFFVQERNAILTFEGELSTPNIGSPSIFTWEKEDVLRLISEADSNSFSLNLELDSSPSFATSNNNLPTL
jgi:hypothetical protein